jgi:hypothetical protein
MSSSVLSEQVFSQGGIIITKHQNHLKGDIVEALQCLKCLLRRDLILCTPVEDDSDNKDSEDAEEGWDCFVEDDSDNNGFDADDESL